MAAARVKETFGLGLQRPPSAFELFCVQEAMNKGETSESFKADISSYLNAWTALDPKKRDKFSAEATTLQIAYEEMVTIVTSYSNAQICRCVTTNHDVPVQVAKENRTAATQDWKDDASVGTPVMTEGEGVLMRGKSLRMAWPQKGGRLRDQLLGEVLSDTRGHVWSFEGRMHGDAPMFHCQGLTMWKKPSRQDEEGDAQDTWCIGFWGSPPRTLRHVKCNVADSDPNLPPLKLTWTLALDNDGDSVIPTRVPWAFAVAVTPRFHALLEDLQTEINEANDKQAGRDLLRNACVKAAESSADNQE